MPEPSEELARAEEEIRRLRALLVERDRELGAAKGRQAELERYSTNLTSIGRRVRNQLERLRGIVAVTLRRLLGRGPRGD